jgi:hypothetical protein
MQKSMCFLLKIAFFGDFLPIFTSKVAQTTQILHNFVQTNKTHQNQPDVGSQSEFWGNHTRPPSLEKIVFFSKKLPFSGAKITIPPIVSRISN